MGEFFKDLLALLKKPSPILISISLASGALIFLNENALKKLSLLDFKNKYSLYIGIIFLISTSILVMLIFISIAKAIRNSYMLFRFKRVRIKNLNRLNTEQLNTVVQLYYRPDHSANLDITHSTTALLESAKIIGRASSISVGGSYFSYFLQPWVINYINEHPEFTLNIPESSISHEFTSWY